MEQEALESLSAGPEITPGRQRLFVIPGNRKNELLSLPRFLTESGSNTSTLPELSALIASWVEALDPQVKDSAFCFMPGDFTFHSRAFLKIQDGCDNHCSYCRVRLARGKSRSLPAEEALTALRSLEERGYEEAVLTGVNITQYRGTGEARDLGGLLEYLLSGVRKIRLRLSSIEPELYSPAFISAISKERIRPHFHFSLQSASETVLARMKRSYTPKEAEERIRLIRAARDDPFIACDIITGFPGETQDDFEKTYDFCQSLEFTGIHVFPFSRRPGTPAWDYKDRVTENEAGLRAERLSNLARKNLRVYINRWIGKEVEAIVENDENSEIIENEAPGKNAVSVLSANYLKLLVSLKEGGTPPKPGSLLHCRILGVPEDASRFDANAELLN
jgi:threonylcarbamoyladenosine tRNA methylthiotransferase MtaB